MKITLIYFLLFTLWVEATVGFSMTPIRGLSLMNLTIYMLLFLWLCKALRTRKLWESNNINNALFMLMLVYTISIPIKIMIGEVQNIKVWREIVTLKNKFEPLLVFFILFNYLETKDECRRAIRGLLILLVVSLISMFFVTFGIASFSGIHVWKSEHELVRTTGFGNPNDYAVYLVLFIPLMISFLLFEKVFLKRALSFIVLLMSILGLIMTGSRGGILSFLISILAYLSVLSRKKIIRRRALIILVPMLVLLSIAAYYLAPAPVTDTLEMRIEGASADSLDKFTSGRTLLLRHGLQHFIESPIYGHGQGSFIPLQKRRFGKGVTAHNLYLLYMVEYGVIGLVTFLIILIKIYRHLLYNIAATAEFKRKLIYVSYLAGFCGYTFSLLSGDAHASFLYFWIYTAIIYKYSKTGN